MDTSDVIHTIPWKNLTECEELLKYFYNKTSNPIKCRQLLIQLQSLTNQSEEYRLQLFQTISKCFHSTSKDEFINNFLKQFNISFVLLNILLKTSDYKNLIDIFKIYNNNQEKTIFQMKINELNHRFKELNSEKTFTINNLLNNDFGFEKQFSEYFKLNNQNETECKQLLINFLVQSENHLSEPTIGLILDRLEKLDYKSSTNSIYSNDILFSQRTHSSISQRLLLKQFLHSCSWSTILDTIYNLLTLSSTTIKSFSINSIEHSSSRLLPTQTLKQSRFFLINNHDSTLILDMIESFIKLSPLWSGRESKMLERCHDELIIDFNFQHIYTLIIYILDESDRCLLSNEEIYQQYQKRYEKILYNLIKIPEKKSLIEECLEKLLIDFQSTEWIKDLLTKFYLIIYLNQSDLFKENFYLILPKFFQEFKQINFLEKNYNYFIHDLLIRLNSYDLISIENFHEINLLLKEYLSKYPILFLRYLKIIKLNLQSRLSTLTNEEFNQRNSKQRLFFLSLFDLIYRLKPYIYDQIYEKDFQSILDIYIRLIIRNLNQLNTCTKQSFAVLNYLQDYIYLIDKMLDLIYNYLHTTINNNQHLNLFKIYNNKFFEKIQEKIQTNKELTQILISNKYNLILYHLRQLKILYEAIKIDENTGTFARLFY